MGVASKRKETVVIERYGSHWLVEHTISTV
jgi:hypothetical protein